MYEAVAIAAKVREQIQIAENRATEIEDRFSQMVAANETATVKIRELTELRQALEQRVADLEREAPKVLAAQPAIIVDALKRWMNDDPKGLAKALYAFLNKAPE